MHSIRFTTKRSLYELRFGASVTQLFKFDADLDDWFLLVDQVVESNVIYEGVEAQIRGLVLADRAERGVWHTTRVTSIRFMLQQEPVRIPVRQRIPVLSITKET